REDAVREKTGARRRAQGSREHRSQESGDRFATAVSSGREEIPRRAWRKGAVGARGQSTCPTPTTAPNRPTNLWSPTRLSRRLKNSSRRRRAQSAASAVGSPA